MKLEGTKRLDARRDDVWAVLNDPSRLAKTMPGVEGFEIIDDKRWRANVKVPLGLGGLKMSLDLEKTEERAPEYAQMRIKGNGVGAMLNMTTAFTLTDDDAGGTDMKWEAEIGIAGPVGAMGQRVLQPIVNQQVTQVLSSLEKEVQSGAAAPTPGPGGVGSTEPPMSGGAGSAGAGAGEK